MSFSRPSDQTPHLITEMLNHNAIVSSGIHDLQNYEEATTDASTASRLPWTAVNYQLGQVLAA